METKNITLRRGPDTGTSSCVRVHRILGVVIRLQVVASISSCSKFCLNNIDKDRHARPKIIINHRQGPHCARIKIAKVTSAWAHSEKKDVPASERLRREQR